MKSRGGQHNARGYEGLLRSYAAYHVTDPDTAQPCVEGNVKLEIPVFGGNAIIAFSSSTQDSQRRFSFVAVSSSETKTVPPQPMHLIGM